MESLEERLDTWGLWKSAGQLATSKTNPLARDMIQVSTGTPLPPLLDDCKVKYVDRLIERHLTRKLRAIITIEYQAHRGLPVLRNTRERASILNMEPKAYRSALLRAKRAIDMSLHTPL